MPTDLALLRSIGIRPPYLAFAGTLEPRKDVPALVEAFAALAATRPDAAARGRGPRRLGCGRGAGRGRGERRDHAASSAPAGSRARRSPRSTASPRRWSTRRSRRASAFPHSKRSPAARRSSPRPAPRWPRWSATRPGSSPRAIAEALPRDAGVDARRPRARSRPARRRARPGRSVHLGALDRPAPRGVPPRRGGPGMKVAVTGARGFVGPHLVAHLEACGDEVAAARPPRPGLVRRHRPGGRARAPGRSRVPKSCTTSPR